MEQWKKYENFITKHLREQFPSTEFLYNQKVRGRYSEVMRQIDILFDADALSYKIRGVVECKLYSTKVNVKTVDSFIGFMADVQAQIGIIITDKGFSKAAFNRAKNDPFNIHLEIIPLKELPTWQFDHNKILIPALYEDGIDKNLEDGGRVDQLLSNLAPDFADVFNRLRPISQQLIQKLTTPPFKKTINTIIGEFSAITNKPLNQKIANSMNELLNDHILLQSDTHYSILNPLFALWLISRAAKDEAAKKAQFKEYLSFVVNDRGYRPGIKALIGR